MLSIVVVCSAAAGRDVPLADAAKKADWNAVRVLLEQGADANVRQGDGTTTLHWAAYWDSRASAELLIRAGADVNAANDLGVTPLWVASENGSAAMVERLLQAGANPNGALLLSGETPLMTAARTGNADVVGRLIAKGADVNAKERGRAQTALMWAVAQRHVDVVKVLLAHDADVHARSNVWTEVVKTTRDTANAGRMCQPRADCYIIDIQQGGYTPLLFAARVGDLASAKLLLGAGADVNDTAPYGTSATVVAAHSGHGDVATFLLEKGADPNASGAGYTPLHAAILHKDANLVGALLAHGANPNAPLLSATPTRRDSVDFYFHPSFVGATPFWLAARFKAAKIMRLLADHGADPHFVHNPTSWVDRLTFGKLYQVAEGSTTAVMAGVGMGGREPLIAVDHAGRVAEDARVASQEPDPVEVEALTLETVKVATGLGVDVNVVNADGNTALHAAASRGYENVIRFLVEKGAKLDATNKKGQTPLAAAMAGPRPPKTALELLRKLGAKE
jgi:ankyrin